MFNFDINNRGNWMETNSGRKFYPMFPLPEDIYIEDIAAGLSKMCRYGGQCQQFYSVGEHSLHVSEHCPSGFKLDGLLHDASEAYIADIVRPVKAYFQDYKEVEKRLEQAICERFDLKWPMPNEVREIDNRILVDERTQNMKISGNSWVEIEQLEPLGVTLQYYIPSQCELRFLDRFYTLHG